MHKITLYLLPLILLFGWYSYPILNVRIYEAPADKCSDDYISWKVESLKDDLENMSRLSQDRQDVLKDYITNLKSIPRADTPDINHTLFKYNFLTKNNCHVPKELSDQANKVFLKVENAGNKICATDAYYDESTRFLMDIKANHKPIYDRLISNLKNKFMSDDQQQDTLDILEKNWNISGFQDKLAIAAIQKKMRRDNQCKDISLPMLDILKEFTTLAIQQRNNN